MGRLDLMTDSDRTERSWHGKPITSSTKTQDDQSSENKSQSDIDDRVTDVYTDYDLYLAVKNGDFCDFHRVVERVSTSEQASFAHILRRMTPVGNTFLHLAVKYGHEILVKYIAVKDRSLVFHKNNNGETALHLAAKAGYGSMVEAVVLIHQDMLVNNETSAKNLLRAKNDIGNTILHEALINGKESIARFMIITDPELSYYQNNEGESALYLASKAGYANFISLLLGFATDEER